MYTVMIVDDEEPVVVSFAKMVEEESSDFTVVATARSGVEAIESARTCRPDLFVVDIGMPGLDGLETISELRRHFPDSLYVISTAYERFDFAQRSIPLQVFDYLVKPITRPTFIKMLSKAATHLDALDSRPHRHINELERSEEKKNEYTRAFLLRMAWKRCTSEEWCAGQQRLGFEGSGGMVLLVTNPAQGVVRRFEYRYRCLSTEYFGTRLLFVPDCGNLEASLEYLQTLVTALPIRERRNAPLLVAGGSRQPYDRLYISFSEAIQSLRREGYRGPADLAIDLRVEDFMRRVRRAHSFDELTDPMQDILDKLLAGVPLDVSKAHLIALYTRLIENLYRSTGDGELRWLAPDPVRELSRALTGEEVCAWAWRSLRTIVELTSDAAKEESRSPVLNKALAHIQKSFGELLSLSSLAGYCGVSPGYLSKLFHDQLGVTFVDYLNEIRVNAAERLLAESDRSIKEIAYEVGYQDPNYFGRVYRRLRGTPPTHACVRNRRSGVAEVTRVEM